MGGLWVWVGTGRAAKDREVGFEEGEALASEFNTPFFETSAMNDINVDVELLEANNT